MSKEELIAKAKENRVEFAGNVFVEGVWNGNGFYYYYAQYADKEGIHACPEGEEEYIENYTPFYFDEVGDKVYDQLANDVILYMK